MVFDISALTKLKGYRVRLKVNDEEYEGIVANVITATLCVTLGKARCVTDGVYYHVLFFYTYEIESCFVVNGPEESKIPKKPSNTNEEDGPRLVKLRPLPFQKRGKPPVDINTDNLLIGGTEDKENEYLVGISDNEDDDDDEILPTEKFKYPFPDKNVIIDTINDDFQETISNIMKEQAVGVSLEGGNVGRHGNICLILVSTQSHVYLFDLCALGKNAFDKGLKDVFQNPSVMKIFHDCREPSDALFHLYGIRLINVFDTQSSDALVYYKLQHRMPQSVRSLHSCLSDYLKLNVRIQDFSRRHQWHSGIDLSVWTHRPLSKRLVKAAVKRVVFLKELRYAVLERYLADLNHGAEIYLAIVRDSSEQELELSQAGLHKLPAAFQKLEVKNKKQFRTLRSFEAPDDNIDSYRYLIGNSDPYIAANRHLWFKKERTQKKEPIAEETSNQVSQKNSEDEHYGNIRLSDGVAETDIQGKFCHKSDLSVEEDRPEKSQEISKETFSKLQMPKVLSSSSLCYSSLTEKNSSPERCKNQSSNVSVEPEKQSSNVSAEPEKQSYGALVQSENQLCARSFPKKRIDWSKVCPQRANKNTTAAMIPAGMVPTSVLYARKKQSS